MSRYRRSPAIPPGDYWNAEPHTTPDMFMEYQPGGRLDRWCQLLRLVDAFRVAARFAGCFNVNVFDAWKV